MEFRSHLLCCACRLDFATDLTGLAYSTGRVTFYYQSMGNNIENLTQKDNFFVMLHVYVYNSLQKVFKKKYCILHS